MNDFKSGSVKKHAIGNMVFVILGKGLGFFVPLLVAAWFGVSRQTDAFFFVYSLLLSIAVTFGSVLELAVVPQVAELRSRGGDLKGFIRSLFLQVTALLAVILLLVFVFFEFFASLVTRFSTDDIHLASALMWQLAPFVFFWIWSDLCNAILNAYQHFYWSALSPFFRAFTIIVFLYFAKTSLEIHALALAYVFGEGMRLLFSVLGFNLKLKFEPAAQAQAAKEKATSGAFFQVLIYQTLGYGFISCLSLVNQSLASWFGPGALSTYAYSERLRNILLLWFISGVGPVALSYWSEAFSSRTDQQFASWAGLRKTLLKAFFAAAALAVGMFVFRHSLVPLAYRHGKFSAEYLPVVTSLFGFLILGVPFQVITLLCIRILAVLQMHAAYMKITLAVLVVHIVLGLSLSRVMGIQGIACATFLVEIIFAGLLYQRIRAKLLGGAVA